MVMPQTSMPPKKEATIADRLYWAYANLAMAEKAVHDGETEYLRLHFMVRARLYSGLTKGTMSPRTLMHDQRIRMKLPQQCLYCGSVSQLAVDHVIPLNRGGADGGDNAVWACRSCNSSKSDRDLFDWWSKSRPGFPPLFAIRVYLKQAIAYFVARDQMKLKPENLVDSPFSFSSLPSEYPAPRTLIFSPYHAEKAASGQAAGT